MIILAMFNSGNLLGRSKLIGPSKLLKLAVESEFGWVSEVSSESEPDSSAE